MKKQYKVLYIIFAVSVCALVMGIVDAFIKPPYFIKSLIKIALFMIVPILYFSFNKGEIRNFKKLFIPEKKMFLRALLLAAGVFAVIIAAYLVCRNFYDFSSVADKLTSDAGVNADNFIYVSIYISFVNSLLEEFFFRGFAFITLKREYSRLFAYIFSSAVFTFYHVGMTVGWFSPIVFLLMLVGLFIGGCIFNYLNEKSENIYTSWFVHMCANFAINLIGMFLLSNAN
ncbi:MAG: CPBP family intramembrane metalloprotease [Ruminococcaceae bacterium]|nr:CPBP family intramembrane metalloprotease [Oscillospiraceae bacterium]